MSKNNDKRRTKSRAGHILKDDGHGTGNRKVHVKESLWVWFRCATELRVSQDIGAKEVILLWFKLLLNTQPTWCAISWETTTATHCWSFVVDTLLSYSRASIRYVINPQFSIAPAAKSGIATRSATNMQAHKCYTNKTIRCKWSKLICSILITNKQCGWTCNVHTSVYINLYWDIIYFYQVKTLINCHCTTSAVLWYFRVRSGYVAEHRNPVPRRYRSEHSTRMCQLSHVASCFRSFSRQPSMVWLYLGLEERRRWFWRK